MLRFLLVLLLALPSAAIEELEDRVASLEAIIAELKQSGTKSHRQLDHKRELQTSSGGGALLKLESATLTGSGTNLGVGVADNLNLGMGFPDSPLHVFGNAHFADGSIKMSKPGQGNYDWRFLWNNVAQGDFDLQVSEAHPDAATRSQTFQTKLMLSKDGALAQRAKREDNYYNSLQGDYDFVQKGGSVRGVARNIWYPVHGFSTYASTGFFLMAGYEDNEGDGYNTFAIFVDSGTASYGTGFTPERLHGSALIEVRRDGGSLEIRSTQAQTKNPGGQHKILQWQFMHLKSSAN